MRIGWRKQKLGVRERAHRVSNHSLVDIVTSVAFKVVAVDRLWRWRRHLLGSCILSHGRCDAKALRIPVTQLIVGLTQNLELCGCVHALRLLGKVVL